MNAASLRAPPTHAPRLGAQLVVALCNELLIALCCVLTFYSGSSCYVEASLVAGAISTAASVLFAKLGRTLLGRAYARTRWGGVARANAASTGRRGSLQPVVLFELQQAQARTRRRASLAVSKAVTRVSHLATTHHREDSGGSGSGGGSTGGSAGVRRGGGRGRRWSAPEESPSGGWSKRTGSSGGAQRQEGSGSPPTSDRKWSVLSLKSRCACSHTASSGAASVYGGS